MGEEQTVPLHINIVSANGSSRNRDPANEALLHIAHMGQISET